jgi:hypothetical protein
MSGIVAVPSVAIPQLWHLVEPFVLRCFNKSGEHRYSVGDVYSFLLERELQLWITHSDNDINLIVITQILNYPQAKECNIFMVCGTLPDDWQDILSDLVEWAKASGCTHASAMARRGFANHAGWENRETYVVGVL